MTVFECEKIYKSFGEGEAKINAVAGISTTIEEGECVLVMGESGTGKTTFLNLLGGLSVVDSGRIIYRNRDISKLNDNERTTLRKEAFGYVFQFFELVPSLTVEENICLPLYIQGKKQEKEYYYELLEQLKVRNLCGRFPDTLSGGQQQRVAIARAFITKPDCIFADEPTGNLDFKNKQMTRELFAELQKIYKHTLIIATHDEEMKEIANRRIVLQDGKIVGDERLGNL